MRSIDLLVSFELSDCYLLPTDFHGSQVLAPGHPTDRSLLELRSFDRCSITLDTGDWVWTIGPHQYPNWDFLPQVLRVMRVMTHSERIGEFIADLFFELSSPHVDTSC